MLKVVRKLKNVMDVVIIFCGHTVTLGNLKSLIGWVDMTEETGWADQSANEFLIRIPAREKLTMTLKLQRIFPHKDSALLM